MIQTLFGLAYLAHDRTQTAPLVVEALTFLVDYMQVWRVLMQPAFGWTNTTYGVVKFGDFVYVVSWLVALPLPRYALFVAAALVTVVMLGVVALSAQMLKSGDISDKKLVSALRVMIGLFCNVALTSILQFLLIPVDCKQPNQVCRRACVPARAAWHRRAARPFWGGGREARARCAMVPASACELQGRTRGHRLPRVG